MNTTSGSDRWWRSRSRRPRTWRRRSPAARRAGRSPGTSRCRRRRRGPGPRSRRATGRRRRRIRRVGGDGVTSEFLPGGLAGAPWAFRPGASSARDRSVDSGAMASEVRERNPEPVPDARGRFGAYGGRYVPEVLVPALDELAEGWTALRKDAAFQEELRSILRDVVGRPTPLTFASRLSEETGYRIWLKREDLAHTGAHKINNTIGQVLLARRLGKRRIIAETGAGQHGVATATACAMFGLPCVVYMGEEDTRRQAPNVARMELLGAEIVPVTTGSRTLKDAINEALRDWAASVQDTHYVIGSVVGPHPFPAMVRDFPRAIGEQARSQFAAATGDDLPDVVAACVGGGSNAIGMFTAFV